MRCHAGHARQAARSARSARCTWTSARDRCTFQASHAPPTLSGHKILLHPAATALMFMSNWQRFACPKPPLSHARAACQVAAPTMGVAARQRCARTTTETGSGCNCSLRKAAVHCCPATPSDRRPPDASVAGPGSLPGGSSTNGGCDVAGWLLQPSYRMGGDCICRFTQQAAACCHPVPPHATPSCPSPRSLP